MAVTPRRPNPPTVPAPKASTTLDRVTAAPVPAGWRKRSKPSSTPRCSPQGAGSPPSSAGTFTAGGGTARAIHRSSMTCTGSMTGTRPTDTKSSRPRMHSSRVSAWTLYRMLTVAV